DIMMNCPTCNSNYLQQVGTGTQRVEEEVKKLFPQARVERLDLDISRKGAQEELLRKMKNKEIDILIGTQMVAKGLDFPNVSLVGIIDSDSMLALPDFRAAERTFQLIVQAAGRAGRGNKPGEVVIQTYSPDNSIITWAAKQDYISFYFEELRQRNILNYPPFTSLLRIVVSSNNEEKVIEKTILIAELISEVTDAKEDYLQILGPAPCPIQKIRNKYRYQIIVKSNNKLLLKSIGQFISNEVNFPNGKIDIDINPNSMM
ncbi:MAG: primosomal protein N', partial [Syntrophomonadaceae bacterium]|nr:primosomal protein N' [Syntrophomonadaceae bacterium]